MQPEMTQVVFIAASEQYEASGWSNLAFKPEQHYDAQTQTHYGAWLAKVIDDAGGTAFVTELAAPFRELERPNRFMSEDDGEEGVDMFLNRLREDHSHLTRLVTRVSPWEVDSNPVFVPTEAEIADLIAYLLSIDADTEEQPIPTGFDICRPAFP